MPRSRSASRPKPRASSRSRRLGRLIVVEGIDGSGKSTQIQLLHKWLEARGTEVVFSAWNSSNLVRQATKRGKKKNLLTPTTFSLLHSVDFADRLLHLILPPLKAGMVVLADRYVYTAFARDAVRGVDHGWVRDVYGFAPKPDLALYFKVPIEVSLQRILTGRAALKFHEAGMDLNLSADPYESFRLFQGRIFEQYLAMSTEFRFTIMDANQRIEEQQGLVRKLLTTKVDIRKFTTRKAL